MVTLVHLFPCSVALPALALEVVGLSLGGHTALDPALNHILQAEHWAKYDEWCRVYCKYSRIDLDAPNCMLRRVSGVIGAFVAFDEFGISIHLVSSFLLFFLLRSGH